MRPSPGFETFVVGDACRAIDLDGSLARARADMGALRSGLKWLQLRLNPVAAEALRTVERLVGTAEQLVEGIQ